VGAWSLGDMATNCQFNSQDRDFGLASVSACGIQFPPSAPDRGHGA